MTLEIWDPHFHIWDVSENTQSGHDPSELFAPQDDPIYSLSRYEDYMTVKGFELTGGVFVKLLAYVIWKQTDLLLNQPVMQKPDGSQVN